MILHTKKRSAHEFTSGMPSNKSQNVHHKGEAKMRDTKVSRRIFFNLLSTASLKSLALKDQCLSIKSPLCSHSRAVLQG